MQKKFLPMPICHPANRASPPVDTKLKLSVVHSTPFEDPSLYRSLAG
ncbi:hypothetical protein A2U01_0057753, partial [Trifolium medium]|nr:hypothetical protein [Trifolium medium]